MPNMCKTKHTLHLNTSDDEKGDEKVIYVEEPLFKFLVRIILTIVIFGLLYYYLRPYQEFESQDDRIQRVIMEEKLRQMGIQEKGLRDRV